jgi:wyosine [tRNA(Phe)-imidazoG37] synthetase (radical SAM superfamily)
MSQRRVYGPVPSRRLGLSLGVDLVPFKTCCYDCVYCQLGETTRLTVEPEEFYPLGEVLADVEAALEPGPRPDVITLAGSGDPTLYRPLGELIDGLHELADIPVVLLCNGALLFDPRVAQAALKADILAPSLDAGDPHTFVEINRPHPSISFADMLKGLLDVCEKHPGKVRLEVMLVGGLNDSDEGIQRIAGQLGPIRADSIDINTPVRPVPGGKAAPCDPQRLEVAARAFGPNARIIADYPKATGPRAADAEHRILEMLSRRPCTVEDLCAALGLHPNEAIKMLDRAMKSGKVEKREGEGKTFYFSSGS